MWEPVAIIRTAGSRGLNVNSVPLCCQNLLALRPWNAGCVFFSRSLARSLSLSLPLPPNPPTPTLTHQLTRSIARSPNLIHKR